MHVIVAALRSKALLADLVVLLSLWVLLMRLPHLEEALRRVLVQPQELIVMPLVLLD